MIAVPQIGPESPAQQQKTSSLNLHRFYRHLRQASGILERQMQRGAPPHIKRVFCQIQAGLVLAAESVRHAQRSSRHGD
jgi:hypothetical protein